ncbi:MAG TPA: hypothetical protein VFY74_06735 [Methyloceanibacter sp.]|jgi:hypothetical protein|nr:hypothetical protein [Methyloceanibacter sp.]
MTINLEMDAEPRNETARSRTAHGGAPPGSRNGRYVDGNFTKEAIAERRLLRRLITGSGPGKMTSESVVNHEHPNRVSIEVEKGEGRYAVKAPANQDKRDWTRRLQKALGSRSKAFIVASLDRLLAACHLPRQLIPTSTSVSSALALIESLEPKNEIEAALAVEIACLHAACGTLLGRLADACLDRPTIAAANAVAKLERALHSAINTFYRVKHGNTQVIRIERIEIQSGAQAVLGPVMRP